MLVRGVAEMKKNYVFPAKNGLEPQYELPDPFLKPDGTRVKTAAEWEEQRGYLKAMLEHYLYGHMPPPPGNTRGRVIGREEVFGGRALLEKVQISFGPEISFEAEICRPNESGKVPVITINSEGVLKSCPVIEELVTERKIALAAFGREQLGPDSYEFYDPAKSLLIAAYPDYDWRAIAVWSWGHCRLNDYLEQTDYADMSKIGATGYSRGGKIALCAAVYDERISVCMAGGSGCGGNGCYRYLGGRLGMGDGVQETLGSMSEIIGFWFADGLGEFGAHSNVWSGAPAFTAEENAARRRAMDYSFCGKTGDEVYLPFDLHFIRSLIAPRAVIGTEALGDDWANPYGTAVSWRAAAEVFRFLGAEAGNAMFFRDGPHMYSKEEWLVALDFFEERTRGHNAVRPLYMTVRTPEPGAKRNTLVEDWFYKTPHFSWRAPEKV